MKKYAHLVLFILLTASCVPYIKPKPKMLNSKTNYFDANQHVKVTVVSNISVNADTLKQLLVVPNEDYYFEMGKNLEYFKDVMTYSQLQNIILELGDTLNLRLESPDKLKLYKAAKLYKPFVIMERPYSRLDENYAWITGFKVYDPLRGETIFENKMFGDLSYPGNKGTYFPLFNSFLEYLRKQK